MRVLHATRSLDLQDGGPIVTLIGLARAQAAEGLQVSVVASWCAQRELEMADSLRASGVTVHLVGPAHGALRRHPSMTNVVAHAAHQADVVHNHMLYEEIQHEAIGQATKLGLPCVWKLCGMLDPWSLRQSQLKKKVYMALRLRKDLRRSRALHSATQAEADFAAQLELGVPSIVEPNGIDLDEFAQLPPAGAFRSRYPQLGTRPYVVFLGRLHPGKGVELLASAFAKLRDTEAMLVVVGPDEEGYQSQLARMVREHRLDDRVIFTGMLSGVDRVAALAEADLFVLPSQHENFGVAVVEALAAGTPVIVSDQVYLHPDVTAAQVGAVVPLEVDALTRELDRWLSGDELRNAASERARPFVWQRYDWRRIARRWREHYERLTAERS